MSMDERIIVSIGCLFFFMKGIRLVHDSSSSWGYTTGDPPIEIAPGFLSKKMSQMGDICFLNDVLILL